MKPTGASTSRLWIARCVRIMDIKCPSSGMADHNRMENLQHLTDRDQIKFVVGDREDYCFARDLVTSGSPGILCGAGRDGPFLRWFTAG